MNRGDGDEEEEETKFEDDGKERQLEDYQRIVHKNTEFFSTEKADILL